MLNLAYIPCLNPPPHVETVSPIAAYKSGERMRNGCRATQSWYKETGVVPRGDVVVCSSCTPVPPLMPLLTFSCCTCAMSASAVGAHASGSITARRPAMRASVGSGNAEGSANNPVVSPTDPGLTDATSSANALYKFSFLCERSNRQVSESGSNKVQVSPFSLEAERCLLVSPPRSNSCTSRITVVPGLPDSARHAAHKSLKLVFPCSPKKGCA